ncbi:MAG: acetyltransferase [Acidobacteria bacterium]|nr:acetyltransferase [Acidobacteriota bacterium]
MQKVIWGFEDLELLPVRLFVVANKVGGQTMAAFDGEKMVGFLIAVPGIRTGGECYLHSNMMGVLAEYRNAGVGRQLKFAQREEALSRGFKLIEWTFDPLELKNAFFNVERLGAVVHRYVLNQYGVTTSRLHGGLPTDRCIASWYLDRPAPARTPVIERIDVPNEIATLRLEQPAEARRLQGSISERFLEYLRRGLAVTAFERGETHSSYLFTEWK